ncbi:hypothetical protein EW146_g9706 [Bondarzewia mesenterica]|uniref:RING-type domain-containing protein n=1 Tax=Bondarzewia mesenterica TaxID=1095465 RepID=A0A4S4L4A3_9AGAM|nr:hypothetical protein EW146_g9706 [Bondarzewia mesenterica]
MLVIHPDSTCDVCLDPYSPDKTPYAIHCGHIFCVACLQRTEPPICPLCRAGFRDYKRLVVDHVAQQTEDPSHREAIDLMERIALVSGPNAPTADVNQVTGDARAWLDRHSENSESNLPLRSALSALERHKDLQQKRAEDKRMIREYRHRLRRRDMMANADDQNTRVVEESLTARVDDLEKRVPGTAISRFLLYSCILKGIQLADRDEELAYWHRNFPAYGRIRHSVPLNRPSDTDQDSQDTTTPLNSTGNNPLPLPPKPVSLSAYRRRSIPDFDLHPFLGSGAATFIPGARHEDRVVPPAEMFSYAGSDGREDREHRHRRREAETVEQREERKRRHRERAMARQRARDGEDDAVQPSTILPGNALGIGSSSHENIAAPPMEPTLSASGGYNYALYPQPEGSTSVPGTVVQYPGLGSSSTNVNMVGPVPDPSSIRAADVSRVPRMGEPDENIVREAQLVAEPTPFVPIPSAWTPYANPLENARASRASIGHRSLSNPPAASASASPQAQSAEDQEMEAFRHQLDEVLSPPIVDTSSVRRTSIDSWGAPAAPPSHHHSRNSSMSNIFNESHLRQLGAAPDGGASRDSLDTTMASGGLLGLRPARASREQVAGPSTGLYAYPAANSSQVSHERPTAQRLSTWGGPLPQQEFPHPYYERLRTDSDGRSMHSSSRPHSRTRVRTMSESQTSVAPASASVPYVSSPWVQPASTPMPMPGWPYAPAPQLHISAALRQPHSASTTSLHSQGGASARSQSSARSGRLSMLGS